MAISQERKGTIAVSLTNFLDSGCIVASSCAMTIWAAAFGFDKVADPQQLWVAILGAIGANAFGAAVGALIGGFLTDRFGRKLIYTYNLLVYAAGVFLCMIALNLPMLVIGIILSGLSVGAGVPASWSYISEMSSSTKRASNIGISQFAWSCGPAIIFALSLIVSFIVPAFNANGALFPAGTYGPFDGVLGMRIIYAILFIVALIAWNLQRQLQESKDWAAKQKEAEKNKSKVGFGRMMLDALKNPINLKTILFLVAVYLTWNIVAGTQGQFLPYMYQAVGGLNETQTSLLNMVTWILTAIGSLAIFAALGDRVPHRILFFVTAAMAVAAWGVMIFFGMQMEAGNANQWGWLLWVFSGLWGISAGFSAQCFYALWSTELFPTRYRGGVQGIMFFLVRGVLGLWSLFVVAGLGVGTPNGFITASWIMTGILIVSLVVGVVGCPKTQGKTLDEITKERYGKLDV
ncbi:MAG: MFS transporter [Coriobacteriia bacterium]|nr:MFS transporter [Coriobacteriia bacterium]